MLDLPYRRLRAGSLKAYEDGLVAYGLIPKTKGQLELFDDKYKRDLFAVESTFKTILNNGPNGLSTYAYYLYLNLVFFNSQVRRSRHISMNLRRKGHIYKEDAVRARKGRFVIKKDIEVVKGNFPDNIIKKVVTDKRVSNEKCKKLAGQTCLPSLPISNKAYKHEKQLLEAGLIHKEWSISNEHEYHVVFPSTGVYVPNVALCKETWRSNCIGFKTEVHISRLTRFQLLKLVMLAYQPYINHRISFLLFLEYFNETILNGKLKAKVSLRKVAVKLGVSLDTLRLAKKSLQALGLLTCTGYGKAQETQIELMDWPLVLSLNLPEHNLKAFNRLYQYGSLSNLLDIGHKEIIAKRDIKKNDASTVIKSNGEWTRTLEKEPSLTVEKGQTLPLSLESYFLTLNPILFLYLNGEIKYGINPLDSIKFLFLIKSSIYIYRNNNNNYVISLKELDKDSYSDIKKVKGNDFIKIANAGLTSNEAKAPFSNPSPQSPPPFNFTLNATQLQYFFNYARNMTLVKLNEYLELYPEASEQTAKYEQILHFWIRNKTLQLKGLEACAKLREYIRETEDIVNANAHAQGEGWLSTGEIEFALSSYREYHRHIQRYVKLLKYCSFNSGGELFYFNFPKTFSKQEIAKCLNLATAIRACRASRGEAFTLKQQTGDRNAYCEHFIPSSLKEHEVLSELSGELSCFEQFSYFGISGALRSLSASRLLPPDCLEGEPESVLEFNESFREFGEFITSSDGLHSIKRYNSRCPSDLYSSESTVNANGGTKGVVREGIITALSNDFNNSDKSASGSIRQELVDSAFSLPTRSDLPSSDTNCRTGRKGLTTGHVQSIISSCGVDKETKPNLIFCNHLLEGLTPTNQSRLDKYFELSDMGYGPLKKAVVVSGNKAIAKAKQGISVLLRLVKELYTSYRKCYRGQEFFRESSYSIPTREAESIFGGASGEYKSSKFYTHIRPALLASFEPSTGDAALDVDSKIQVHFRSLFDHFSEVPEIRNYLEKRASEVGFGPAWVYGIAVDTFYNLVNLLNESYSTYKGYFNHVAQLNAEAKVSSDDTNLRQLLYKSSVRDFVAFEVKQKNTSAKFWKGTEVGSDIISLIKQSGISSEVSRQLYINRLLTSVHNATGEYRFVEDSIKGMAGSLLHVYREKGRLEKFNKRLQGCRETLSELLTFLPDEDEPTSETLRIFARSVSHMPVSVWQESGEEFLPASYSEEGLKGSHRLHTSRTTKSSDADKGYDWIRRGMSGLGNRKLTKRQIQDTLTIKPYIERSYKRLKANNA